MSVFGVLEHYCPVLFVCGSMQQLRCNDTFIYDGMLDCNCNFDFLLFIRSVQGLSPQDIELVNKYNIEIYLQNTRIQDKI